MGFTTSRKTAAAGLAVAVLIGGGIATVAPAAADDGAQYAATNWKKIWATLGSYSTKAQSDAAYAAKGSSYTKAESDAKYALTPGLIRGTYALGGTATAGGQPFADSIGFGVTLSAAPTVHYINSGAVPPAGCSGTVAAPVAAAGHLCVFEALGGNVTTRDIDNANGNHPLASPFGANVWAYSTAAGSVYVYGSWAVRPIALAAPAATVAGSGPGVGAGTGR